MQGGTIKLCPSSRNQWLTCTYLYMASYDVNFGVFMLFCFLYYTCLKNTTQTRKMAWPKSEISLQLLNFVIHPYLNELLHFYIFWEIMHN